MNIRIHTDGGARGNPGPAAVGVVIEEIREDPTKPGHTPEVLSVTRFGSRIGETTNNVAEYTAVIQALEWVKNNPDRVGTGTLTIQFILDSTLVVNQLNGLFKVKDIKLRELLFKTRVLEQSVGGRITYTAVRREQNRLADMMVNRALDA